MLKKTVTYEDFDGNLRTEDHYFNLTEAELTEMEYSLNGGFSQLLEKIVKENDQKRIMEYFKEMVIKAYGVKSLDGRQFVKNDKIREEFASTAAYSAIYMELATNTEAAIAFANGIMPKKRTTDHQKPQNLTALPGKAPAEGVTTPATN